MDAIKQSFYVMRALKNKNFEAYFVGGCVRDYLLKRDTIDVDIATNANPYKVMDITKAKPTGLPYGTVSIQKEKFKIEITTYRRDGKYTDNRHPDEVIPVQTIEDDVKRRDFTINGLAMNDSYQIFDYVGGKEDLRSKIIRAIGNPDERFQEDSLRILRAAYFQAKLGFQIEKETRLSMANNKALLQNLPNERVFTELIKLLKEPNQLMALKTLDATGISKELPGLEKGIRFIVDNMKEPIFIDAFFALSFTLHGSVPQAWKFSNIARLKYEKVVELVNRNQPLTNVDLFNQGLEICLLTNKVAFLLGRSSNQKRALEERFEKLPIKSALDLKLRGSDLITILNKKQGAWVSKAIDDMVNAVLEGKVSNTYEALQTYIIEKEAKHEK
ncbi:CCA tRNA nucleotidyltransferase [Acholeplasma vituli]|uniref:CCA tRNA nucleotidyltransferase n=1 Tax=Paracholeplasma vituli TaxID=69473 RepID=A0ABT2PTR8_9MOLU|nr:CCA tRNA nucleotidyltransferase [Paracholeplasma vituli]MCU0104353.1 CCA tRNA nucleotidyltransferase [Paracholeplasma vituli]